MQQTHAADLLFYRHRGPASSSKPCGASSHSSSQPDTKRMSKAEVEDLYKVSTAAWDSPALLCITPFYCSATCWLCQSRQQEACWVGWAQRHRSKSVAAECLV